MRIPVAYKNEQQDKLQNSFSGFNASWQSTSASDDDKLQSSFSEVDDVDQTAVVAETKPEEDRFRRWTQTIDGRPDDYVGGYSPEWIYNYRRRTEGSKKQIKIQGYNAKK